jgi:two-component system, cell cycle response regulator DivK
VVQKILVVEDNELNLKLFCDLLRAHGYSAEPVRDGREAIERARAFVPDLVVMDIQMPHISGLELIEQLKADAGLKHIPIMAVTAYAAKGDEERIRDAGAEGYVSKPISVMKFVAAVAALLDAAAVRNDPPASEIGPLEAEPTEHAAIGRDDLPESASSAAEEAPVESATDESAEGETEHAHTDAPPAPDAGAVPRSDGEPRLL